MDFFHGAKFEISSNRKKKKLFLNEVVIERGVNICSSHVDDSQRKMKKKKKTFSLGLCAFACFLIKGVFGGYKRASRSVWALAATIPCSNRQEEGGCCWELKDVLWLWNIDVGYRTSFFLPRNVRVDGIRPFLPPFIVAIAQGQWKKLGNDTKAVSRTAVLSDTITFLFVSKNGWWISNTCVSAIADEDRLMKRPRCIIAFAPFLLRLSLRHLLYWHWRFWGK